MSKALKEYITRDLNRKLDGITGFVAIEPRGLNSEETHDLRKTLRASGVSLHMVHNRLAKRVIASRVTSPAVSGSGGAEVASEEQKPADSDEKHRLDEIFRGPTAIAVSDKSGGEQIVTSAKAVVGWQKKNKEKLNLKGGVFDGRLLSLEEIDRLAQIPDTKVLQAQIAQMLQAPMRNLAVAAQQILARVVYALSAYKEKLEEDGRTAK